MFLAMVCLSATEPPKPEGFSFDVGGQYTWMSFTSPPTYSGSTGGIQGKFTYQVPSQFFGQIRSIYNLDPLRSSTNKSNGSEWYSEFVGGYSFPLRPSFTLTPYAGLGLDFIHDNRTAYSTFLPISLRYSTYYVVAGLDAHQYWTNWALGLQIDCMPIYNQYLKIKTLSGAAWTMDCKVGAAVRLPVAYRCMKYFWIELAPYYRYFPIGESEVLGLPSRNLNQWGAFLSLRFFIP